MDYLKAVAFFQECALPFGAAYYFAVALYGQSLRHERQLTNERFQSQGPLYKAFFTIDGQAQGGNFNSSSLMYYAA